MILIDFVEWSPLISIIVFSLIITTIQSWIYKKLIDQRKYQELKEKQKSLQARMKENKEPEKMMEIQREMMQVSMENMRLTMKPMLITLLPLLLVFYGLKWLYVDATQTGNIIAWNINLPLVGTGAGWLLSYIIFGLIFSLILRKAFGL